MSDLTVTAILRANVDNFTKGLSAAKAALGELKGSSGKGFAGINKGMLGANLAAQAIGSTLSAVSSGIGSMVGELNDSSKAWKTFEGNMKMMGKSGGEIDSVKKSLQDYATQTIYSASDMASTFSQMAAIGYKDSEKLVKGMGGIAASAENPQQAMKSMSQQMTQALSKPTMQWQDFRIMLEQAPAGMSAVAKEMGMTMDEMVQAIQNGEISSKDFADAVAKVGTNETFSNMATQFKTVDQAIDGLREGLANKLQPAFEALSKIGINVAKSLANALDKVDFGGLKDKIMQARFAVISFFKGFEKTGAINALKSALSSVGNAIKNVIGAFTGASPKAVDLGESFGKLATSAANAVKSVADFIAGLDPGTIQSVAKSILGIALAFKGFKAFKAAKKAFNMFKSNPLDMFKKSASKSGGVITQIFRGIGNVIKSLGQGIKTVFQGASQFVKAFGQGLSSAFQGLGKGIGSVLESFGRMTMAMNPVNALAFGAAILLIGAAIALVATQSEGISQIFEAIGSAISAVVVAIGEALGTLVTAIAGGMATIIGAVASGASQIITAFTPIAQIISDTIIGVTEAIAPFIPAITEMVSNVVAQLPKIISAFSGLVAEVGGAISGIINSVTGLVTAIGPVLESAGQMFKDMGEGVKTALDGVSGVVEEVGSAIEKALGGIEGIITAVGDSAEKMGNGFKTFSEGLIAIGGADLDLMGIGTGLGFVANGIRNISNAGVETVSSGLQMIQSALSGIFGVSALAGDFTALGTALSGFPAGNSVGSTLQSIGSSLKNIFGVSALAGDFTALKTALTGFGSVGSQFAVVGVAVVLLQTQLTQFSNQVKQAMNTSKQAVLTGMSAMVTAMVSGGARMVSTAQSISSRVVNVFNQLASKMRTAGVNAGNGFNNGLASTSGAILATANRIASQVASTIQKSLDIHSPSRLLAWMGRMVGQGLINGMSAMVSGVQSVSELMASAAMPNIGDMALGNFSGGVITHELSADTTQTNMMAQLIDEVRNGQTVVLNTGELVGGTKNAMDSALGQNGNLGSRWNLS